MQSYRPAPGAEAASPRPAHALSVCNDLPLRELHIYMWLATGSDHEPAPNPGGTMNLQWLKY